MYVRSVLTSFCVAFLLLGCAEEELQSTEKVVSKESGLENKTEEDLDQKEAGDQEKTGELDDNDNIEKNNSQDKKSSGTISNPVTVDNPTGVTTVVNKQRKLPDGYVPPDLVVPNVPFYFDEDHPKKQVRQEAASALEELFAAAKQDGLDLVAASGYRSHERQKQIYNSNVESKGQEHADKFSARPGTSEHQTGLAMDVTSAEVAFALEQSFQQTDEGSWLEDNAFHYGFIIRYPEGKSNITGYSYEPWHLRYVGKDLASQIHQEDSTLEEHFDL